jgi:hypothetical protein
MKTRILIVTMCSVFIGACQEEQLQRLTPSISVCPAPEAPQDQCDRSVDVGDVPVTVPLGLALFVRDVGGARLVLSAVTSSDPVLVLGDIPDEVFAGAEAPVPFTIALPADALGPRTITLEFVSDDPSKPRHPIELLLNGVPKPAPDVIVCFDDDGTETCGVDLDVDFGTVRRTQERGVQLLVKNVGTAPLSIEEVRLDGAPSLDGEIVIATSTRPARLDVDDSAPLVVVYRPGDGGVDEATLVLDSDDEDTPELIVRLRGEAQANEPPVVGAFESVSMSLSGTAIVGGEVQLDGAASFDPEGDPLAFTWTLTPPASSAAQLDDDSAARVTFTPDVAGVYTSTLVVRDSLGQTSALAQVSVNARPRFGFRAQATWAEAGDIDLHLVEAGATLFSARDCNYANRDVDFGVAGAPEDDCQLLDDAETAPGPEQAVITAPATGTYEIWAHVFDDGAPNVPGGDVGVIDVTVRVILDDAAAPALLQERQLPGDCTTWHVADITFPSGAITVIDGSLGNQCF